jgi:2-methylcitrate dehydratase PrpD
MTGLTSRVAEFVARLRPDDVPADCLKAAATGLTDFVAVTIAGAAEDAPRIVSELVRPANLGTSAPVIPSGVLYDAPDAALINGTAGHVLDFDDVGIDGHPSVILGPAILAEGFALDRPGALALAAYVAGYEVWALLKSLEPGMIHDRGFHPTAVCGTLATTAACAMLHGLDAEQTRNAIAIGASLAAGLVANFGTMTKSLHAGRTAQSGILAARLAARGYTGAADALEHPVGFLAAHSPSGRPDRSGDNAQLGERWRMRDFGINIKSYPICYATHRCIDAMLDLVSAHRLKPEQIREISVGVGATQLVMLRNRAPQTGLEAKFSMEFAMASAVIAGRVGLGQLTDGFVRRPDVQALMQRVTCRAIHDGIPGLPSAPGEPMHADVVEVTLDDGSVLSAPPVALARGSWQRPLDRPGLRAKFLDCATPSLGEERALKLFDQLSSLGELVSLRELALAALAPATAAA